MAAGLFGAEVQKVQGVHKWVDLLHGQPARYASALMH